MTNAEYRPNRASDHHGVDSIAVIDERIDIKGSCPERDGIHEALSHGALRVQGLRMNAGYVVVTAAVDTQCDFPRATASPTLTIGAALTGIGEER